MNEQVHITDLLTEAINTQRTVHLWHKNLDYVLEFDPYTYGHDTLQFEFVWGLMPHSLLYYKFLVKDIRTVKLTPKNFKVVHGATYYNAIEEEVFESVPGIIRVN